MFNKFFDKEPDLPTPQTQIQVQISQSQKSKFDFQDELIEERDVAIRELNKEFVEINQMQKTIATMVFEQGEVVDSIHYNIQLTEQNVKSANRSLEKAEKQQDTGNKISIWVMIGTIITVASGGLIVWGVTK